MTGKLILAAGGTGGHIWPAISFGRWIGRNKPDVSVSYICGRRPLELEIYASAGIEPYRLNIDGSPLSGEGLDRLKRTWGQFTALRESAAFIRSESPDFVLLFGGYVTFPVLLASRMLRIPSAVHEQNAYAGKVTRIASRMGVEIFSGWRECLPLPASKYTRIGVPVREFDLLPREQAWSELGLPGELPDGPKVLVFSGSLGSATIKDLVLEAASKEEFSSWTFIIPAVSEETEKAKDNVFLLPKVWKTELLYSLADIAVVRGGGSTLTEVSVLGIPSLVIPWEGAADDHQYHNAVSFSSENRGVIWNGRGAGEAFAKNIMRLYHILLEEKDNRKEERHNGAGRICGDLWLAVSSYF